MNEAEEAAEPQVKKGKKDRAVKPLPSTPDEVEALIRRQKRNQRKAWAEGYMTAITAMLRHYREDRDFMYGLDIKFLDEARAAKG